MCFLKTKFTLNILPGEQKQVSKGQVNKQYLVPETIATKWFGNTTPSNAAKLKHQHCWVVDQDDTYKNSMEIPSDLLNLSLH
jgi:hypothetical protein